MNTTKIMVNTIPSMPWMNSPALNCTAAEDLASTTEPLAIGQLSCGSPIPPNQKPKIVATQVAMVPTSAAPAIGCLVSHTRQCVNAGGTCECECVWAGGLAGRSASVTVVMPPPCARPLRRATSGTHVCSTHNCAPTS